MFSERQDSICDMTFDGVPFIVIGRQLLECSYGYDRHASSKVKPDVSSYVLYLFWF